MAAQAGGMRCRNINGWTLSHASHEISIIEHRFPMRSTSSLVSRVVPPLHNRYNRFCVIRSQGYLQCI